MIFFTYQGSWNSNTFSCRKSQAKIAPLVVGTHLVVRNSVRQIRVHDRAQREAIVPGRAKVGYINVSIADSLVLTPLKQGVAFGATVLDERVQRILPVACKITV